MSRVRALSGLLYPARAPDLMWPRVPGPGSGLTFDCGCGLVLRARLPNPGGPAAPGDVRGCLAPSHWTHARLHCGCRPGLLARVWLPLLCCAGCNIGLSPAVPLGGVDVFTPGPSVPVPVWPLGHVGCQGWSPGCHIIFLAPFATRRLRQAEPDIRIDPASQAPWTATARLCSRSGARRSRSVTSDRSGPVTKREDLAERSITNASP